MNFFKDRWQIMINGLVIIPLLFATAISFNYSLVVFVVLGVIISSIPILISIRSAYIAFAKKYVIFLTLGVLVFYAYLIFSNIGFNILTYQNFELQPNILILSILIISALFIYFLILGGTINYQLLIFLTLFIAIMITVLTLVLVSQLNIEWLYEKILLRGIIPPLTIMLFNWGVLFLLVKMIMREIFSGDRFYLLPEYINYAIPILGFIGTVLGISLSATGIAQVIASPDGLSSANLDLSTAIEPLGIAFDTTLVALSLSLVYTLILMLIRTYEQKL